MRVTRLLPFLAVALSACGPTHADLQVVVTNADLAGGTLYFALFNSETDYQARKPFQRAMAADSEQPAAAVFHDLPTGDYVITVFQDTNGNRQLDVNLLGMPTEPYGFSRNAVGNMGRPEFAAAAIRVTETDDQQQTHIELRVLP